MIRTSLNIFLGKFSSPHRKLFHVASISVKFVVRRGLGGRGWPENCLLRKILNWQPTKKVLNGVFFTKKKSGLATTVDTPRPQPLSHKSIIDVITNKYIEKIYTPAYVEHKSLESCQ